LLQERRRADPTRPAMRVQQHYSGNRPPRLFRIHLPASMAMSVPFSLTGICSATPPRCISDSANWLQITEREFKYPHCATWTRRKFKLRPVKDGALRRCYLYFVGLGSASAISVLNRTTGFAEYVLGTIAACTRCCASFSPSSIIAAMRFVHGDDTDVRISLICSGSSG
jgi:hypothetical protein